MAALVGLIAAARLPRPEAAWARQPFTPLAMARAWAAHVESGRERFRFVVMGDSHAQDKFPAELAHLERLRPDFVLHAGDVQQNGATPRGEWWERLAEMGGPFFRKTPFLPVLGNHELSGGPRRLGHARFQAFFSLPRSYYAFDAGRYRFLMLSWGLHSHPWFYNPEWLWLQRELRRARGRPIVVVWHQPLYTVGAKRDAPARVTALLRANGVRLAFGGHDHIYYRTRRDGLTSVITSIAYGVYPLQRTRDARAGDVYVGIDPATGKVVLGRPGETPAERPVDVAHCVAVVDVNGNRMNVRVVNQEDRQIDAFAVE